MSPDPFNAAQVWNATSATNRGNFSFPQNFSRFSQAYRHLFVSQTLSLCLLSADCAIVIRGKYFPEPLSINLLNNNLSTEKSLVSDKGFFSEDYISAFHRPCRLQNSYAATGLDAPIGNTATGSPVCSSSFTIKLPSS